MKKIVFVALILLLVSAGFSLYLFKSKQNTSKANNSLIIVETDGPNVLLISIDTLRADHLSCYGYVRNTSPNIEKIAKQGVLFTQAISPASWTTPAHMSIFTSLYSIRHNVLNTKMKLNDDIITLAQVLQKNGYATYACISAPTMLPAKLGFDKGFDVYDDYTVGFDLAVNLFKLNDLYGGQNDHPICPLTHTMATTFLKKNLNSKFFLFVHYWDVHGNYDAPEPYKKMFDKDYEGDFDGTYKYIKKIKPGIAKRDLEHMVARYDGEIRYVDDYIGKLMDELKKLGLLDNTLIVLTADHGEEFLEHGGNWHGKTLYEEVIHVPLIIRYPLSIPQSKIITTPISTVNIMPTILDILNIPLRFQVQGESLLALIKGKTRRLTESVYSEKTKDKLKTIRTDVFKLIYDFQNGSKQLFNLKMDKEERENLIDEEINVARDLENRLLTWIEASGSSMKEAAKLDEETKQRLKSLGYLQ